MLGKNGDFGILEGHGPFALSLNPPMPSWPELKTDCSLFCSFEYMNYRQK